MKKLSLLLIVLTTSSVFTVKTKITDYDKRNLMLIGAASIVLTTGGCYAYYYYSNNANKSTVTTPQQPSAEQQNAKPKKALTLTDILKKRDPDVEEVIKQHQQPKATAVTAPLEQKTAQQSAGGEQVLKQEPTKQPVKQSTDAQVQPSLFDTLKNSKPVKFLKEKYEHFKR